MCTSINVKDSPYNATGDGTTDDRAAIQAAVSAAISTSVPLCFPPGTYKLSAFIDVSDGRGLQIVGSPFATITFPSDDTGVHASGNALTDNQARSAFLVRYSTNVLFENLVFQGGSNIAFDTVNLGVAVYGGGHCQGISLVNCQAYDGNSLYQHDQATSTTGTGVSLTASAGIVTLVASASIFSAGHLGAQFALSNTSDPRNPGVYTIASVVSNTTVTFKSGSVVSETSAFGVTIDDADRGTTLQDCRSNRCRSVVTLPGHSRVLGCEFRQPLTQDLTGIPISFSKVGSVMTMACTNGSWQPQDVIGCYVNISGSTSSLNDTPGPFLITGATARTRFSPATISYSNSSGVAEDGLLATGGFCIFRGEKSGKGAGATALAKSGSTMTLTSLTAAFTSADVGKAIRIALATTSANNGVWTVASVPSSTTLTFTNASGAAETFAGMWSIDGYDSTVSGGNGYGSTHAIYVFAGRSDIEIAHCSFEGIRKNCVKVSGSALPIRSVNVHHNTAFQCGNFYTGGADDAQEHSELHINDNIIMDCGTGRPGWGEGVAITVLGSKGVTVDGNEFYYRQPSVPSVDGRATTAGQYAILASRYVNGKTQPIEDISICGNRGVADRVNTRPGMLLANFISAQNIGLTNYWGSAANSATGTNTGVSLAVSGGVVTLTDSAAAFSQDLVGSKIQIVNATSSANNVTASITAVTGTGTLTYANGSGVSESFPQYGAYRIMRTSGARGGACRLSRNTCDGASSVLLATLSCLGPEIVGNVINGGSLLSEAGSVAPLVHNNRIVAPTTSNAGIVIGATTSWPVVYDNLITYGGIPAGSLVTPQVPTAIRGDVGLGVDSGTRVDHPLLGKRGRCTPNGGRAEGVFGFGSVLVEGDSLEVNGNTWTYTDDASATSPKFHTAAQLATLMTTSGFTGEDYGARFATPIATGHLCVRLTSASTGVDVGYIDLVNVLNPTALVIPRDRSAGGESILYTVGEADAGPVARQIPIWSPLAGYNNVQLAADQSPAGTASTGAALLADGWYVNPNPNNLGASVVVRTVNAATGNEELRWSMY